MSTSVNQYLVYGVSLPADTSTPEALEELRDNPYQALLPEHLDGIFPVVDYMSGEFHVVGMVIAKSAADQYLADSGPLCLKQPSYEQMLAVKRGIAKHYGLHVEPEFHLVTKYR
jgi:hypothetical protein